MTPPPAPVATNPYHEDDLIFVMTTPPERTSKLSPRWKGPFLVKRVPNAYQVTYEDGLVWRTIHINHVKPAKTPAGGFPAPLSPATHFHHHPCTLRGTLRGVSQLLLLLNQPPLPGNRLNQPPLSQSIPSPLLLPARPRPSRVGPPHAQQPIRIQPLALS